MVNKNESYIIRTTGRKPEDIIEWLSPSARKLFYYNPVGKTLSEIFPGFLSAENRADRNGTFISIGAQNFILVFQDIGMKDNVIINLHPINLFIDAEEQSDTSSEEVRKRTQALRMAVKDLELNRKKLSHANAVTGTGTFEYIHDLKCLILSPEACGVLGFSADKSVVNIEDICKNTKEKGFSQLCEVMSDAADKTMVETEITLSHPDGSEKHLRIVMKKLSPGTHTLDGILHDITETKIAEKELRRQDTYYRTLYDNANIGIFTLDKDGLIKDYNKYLQHLIGYQPSELKGKKASDTIIRPDCKDKILDAYKQLMTVESRIQPVDFAIIRKDGTDVDVLGSFEYIDDGEEPLFFGFISDISEYKKIHSKNLEQERMLLQQSKMATMGEMVGIIAHQWVQPLNSISMISQMMQELLDVDEESEKLISKTVSSIVEQIKFMTDTVNDFRDFLKPSSKASEFVLSEAVVSVMDLYRPQLKYHNIKCGIFFDSEVAKKAVVYGYENEFKNVVLNLCTNAKDALEQNSAEEGEIDITLSSLDDGRYVSVAVEDNGGGIPEHMLEKIFNAYISTKGEKGTGLGLYMSKLIINDRMNGEINVENTEKGAKIIITLENKNYRAV